MTARNAANLERQREAMTTLAAETGKPILLWSYTLPAPASVKLLSEAGYPLFTDIPNCARTLRAMADYRALRERFLRPIEVRAPFDADRAAAQKALAAAGPVLCEWEARPILAAYGIGSKDAGELAESADAAAAAAQKIGGAVALKVQSPDIAHKTEAGAVALNLDACRCRSDRLRARARQRVARSAECAGAGRAGAADGIAGTRGDPRRETRCHLRSAADGRSRRRQRGNLQGRGAGAAAAERGRCPRHAGSSQGCAAAGIHSGASRRRMWTRLSI